ncbi:MAG: AMP-binding protein [Pseudomonadota bacterium]
MITWMHRQDHEILDRPPEVQARLTSCGQPSFGCHVRIVDEKGNDVPPGEVGEIIVKSRHTMIEYWRKPEETAKALVDGWLHTGDMGRYDEQGYIYIVDRKNDMIISGGENIYPREVEEVLYRHPAVLECCVIGIPHPKWVESVHAVVSFKRGMSATPEELMEFCRQNIARYKAPKSVEILDELPKSSANKILKRLLREKYWAGYERKI